MIIGICDDNDLHLEYVKQHVSKLLNPCKDITIEAITPVQLSHSIKHQSFHYDILISDIDMGSYNGIDFATDINRINSSCIIIFISSFLDYAKDVYDVQHIYFVLKSEMETRLKKALDKALHVYQYRKNQYITFRYQNVDYRLPLEKITYIEAMGRYLYIHDAEQYYTTIESLKSQLDKLSDSFIQCHKSFIVNMNYIQMISRTNCILTSGGHIPISKTYSKSIRDSYIRHISNKLI